MTPLTAREVLLQQQPALSGESPAHQPRFTDHAPIGVPSALGVRPGRLAAAAEEFVHRPSETVPMSTGSRQRHPSARSFGERGSVDFDDATSWLVREQLGVVARSQLVEAGLSDAALRWQLEHRWRILLPGVYALDRRRPTRAQREVAGLLAAAPQAALRGLTAARWWGLTCADPGDRVHVMVPSPRRTRQVAWLDVARSTIPDSGTVNRGPFQVCSPARAVLDAAQQSASTEVAAALGIEALQRNLVTLDRLEDELCRRNQRGSALARHAVNAAGTGAWSRPEAVLLAAIARSSVLPVAWPNPELSCGGRPLVTPDAWFDDVGLAVMVHSRRHHAAGPDWDQTVERDGELTELGIIVVGVTPNRIFQDLPSVVARVERTHLAARHRPRPPVNARRRSLTESASTNRG